MTPAVPEAAPAYEQGNCLSPENSFGALCVASQPREASQSWHMPMCFGHRLLRARALWVDPRP